MKAAILSDQRCFYCSLHDFFCRIDVEWPSADVITVLMSTSQIQLQQKLERCTQRNEMGDGRVTVPPPANEYIYFSAQIKSVFTEHYRHNVEASKCSVM